MNKLEFINALARQLSPLPTEEITALLNYYTELIDDRMDDGMGEEEAVASLGSVEELAKTILNGSDTTDTVRPIPADDSISPAKKRIHPLVVILLILGSPVWLSLAAGLLSAAAGVYVVAWTLLLLVVFLPVLLIAVGIFSAAAVFFAAVTPNTLAVRFLGCGVTLLAAGVGALLLPLSIFLVRKFIALHRLVLRRLFKRKERSQ